MEASELIPLLNLLMPTARISSLWPLLLDRSICSWGQLGKLKREMVCDVPHE